MKNIFEKLFLFLIPVLFAFPLFKENISTILFICLSITAVSYNLLIKKEIGIQLKSLYLTIPFWIFFIFTIVYFVYPQSFKYLKHGLFFLFFPIVFPLIPKNYFTSKKVDFYINILKISCIIVSSGFIIGFLNKYDFKDFFVYRYEIPKFRDFVYNEITFFKIHPTYFTSIIILCVAFSFEKVLNEKKYYELLYIAIFLLITFLLLSKINIIFLGILLFFMVLFRSNFTWKLKTAGVSSLIAIIVILTFTVPGIKNRFYEIYNSYNSPPKDLAYDSTNIRIALMKCNIEVAKENYLWGVGFDAIFDELQDCHKSNYNAGFYQNHKYLTHNYFAYMLITTGIFGLLAFLFYCSLTVRESLKVNRFLLYVVLVNAFIICLTEDYFYRHFGVFYFNLILMTFINSSRNKEVTKTQKSF